jgi:hypothetical protein
MAITEKRVSLDNIGGHKVPMPRKSDEEIEDSFMKEVEPSGATPSLPEKIISNEKTINYDKPKIVTKEQMKAAGFDNLRDYLNDKQGLKRRGETASPSSSSNPLDSEKGNSRGQKAPMAMAVKTTMGQGKRPYDPGSVDNSFVGSKFAKGGVTSKYMSFTKTGKPDGMKPVMAKGGVTRSSASKRADGCATKGFTKGKNL